MYHSKNHGFTLIELILSMTFIAILLIMIAMTTIQVSHIYTKGITLRAVNAAGRAVTSDLRQTIANSAPIDPTMNNGHFVTRFDQGGRLCFGQISYVWNYGPALAGSRGLRPLTTYKEGGAPHFAKVVDPGSTLCNNRGATSIKKRDATELLTAGDRDLAIQQFSISRTDSGDSAQALYAITMLIGTNDTAQLTGAACKVPSQAQGGEDYCAVNQFDIVVRASNSLAGDN